VKILRKKMNEGLTDDQFGFDREGPSWIAVYLPGMDEKGISTAGGARAAWFKDTEGNIMAVIQDV
jgi:hypothetical protein